MTFLKHWSGKSNVGSGKGEMSILGLQAISQDTVSNTHAGWSQQLLLEWNIVHHLTENDEVHQLIVNKQLE